MSEPPIPTIALEDLFGHEEILNVKWLVQLKRGQNRIEWEGDGITVKIPSDGVYSVAGRAHAGRMFLGVSTTPENEIITTEQG